MAEAPRLKILRRSCAERTTILRRWARVLPLGSPIIGRRKKRGYAERVRHPLGNDIFVITAAGIGLAWGSNLLAARSLPALWDTVSGIGCFLAYEVAGWTRLLNGSEKSGIYYGAVGRKTRLLFRRGN
jgi:hypothetical protein